MAASGTVRSRGSLSKYTSAAAVIPYAWCPKYARLRYFSRICALLSLRSTARASLISRSLRAPVCSVAAATCSGVVAVSSSTLRTYCMVSVDAPWDTSPERWLATNARAMPLKSTPWWE